MELYFFDGLYKITKTKLILSSFIMILALFVVIIQYLNYSDNNSYGPTYSEVFLILLTNLLAISSMLFSNDWICTIISLELFNLSLYLLVSLNSYTEKSLGSSLKYFLLSALSTAFLLLGVSLTYFIVGSTNYDSISISVSQLFYLIPNVSNPLDLLFSPLHILSIAFLLILITFLFKLSAAPLHNWAPD